MSRSRIFYAALAACGLALLTSTVAHASVSTADAVLQYTPGADVPSSYWGEPYSNFYSSAPLGLPEASITVAENDPEGIYPDDSFVTPFNAQYNPEKIVAIGGAGGYIQLHMSQPISTDGFTLGVHTGSALNDSAWPNGINYNSASTYTDTRAATVLVSDGSTWVTLGTFDFNNPTNIYSDIAGPYATTPGTHPANFAQPFLGHISDFNNLDFADTITALNGSAGGTWLDLSATGLADVTDVAFETTDGQTMYIDSVVGIPVPEPTALVLLFVPIIASKRNRH